MRFFSKFLYDNGAEGGNSGGAAQAAEAGKEGQQQQNEIPKSIFTDDELKSFGYDSPEALKTFLQKQKEEGISPEEKAAKENITKANFLKFSADQKLLNVEDYSQYETLKSKPDQELVYESFLKEYKEEHPEITDEKELDEAAKEDFDYEYKLKDGLSESAKKKGQAKLARDAKDLRSPIETKITEAQNQFKEYGSYQETYPKFEKLVKEAVLKNTPDKTILYKAKDGEEEIPIEIELTQKDREAMVKEFVTPKTFQKFLNAKPEEVQAMLDKKMNGWVKLNKFDEVNAKTFDIAMGIGTKKGSDVGASNPFALKQNQSNAAASSSDTLEESNAKMSAQREKLRVTR